jgi:hypothetical protein
MATQKRVTMQPTEHDIESEGLPSASGFDAEFRCPGKRALCAQLPKEKDTAITKRGQRIHDALAEGNFGELAPSDQTTASRIAFGEAQIVHEYGFEGAQVEFEVRFWDVDDALNHTWSARVDRHDWQPDKRRLLVVDDKTGWGIPPPVHINWQIRSEVALLAETYDALEAVAVLIHPHHPESLWEARVYDRKACDHLLSVVRHGVKAIQMPDQRRIPGGIQCQFCMAKRVCPEYKAADEALDIAIADEIQDQGFTAINRRTQEERGEHVRQLKEKINNIEFILAQYTELMERDNESIAGWRLARKLTRKVTNEARAMELVKGEYGPELLYECLTFSIKALEDKLAERGTRKDAKAAVARVLAPILRFDKSKYYLEEARSL